MNIYAKKCLDCNKEIPSDSEFCQYCGSKNIIDYELHATNVVYKRCIDCGRELPEDSDFLSVLRKQKSSNCK